MTDPWQNFKNQEINEKIENKLEFEDNFSSAKVSADNSREPVKSSLPDSLSYLESLEKRLEKLKKNPNILEELAIKREECLRNLLNESINLDLQNSIDLDATISGGESAVLDIYRHICPVQPLSVGETVHIVKHDHLAKSEEDSASETESASR